MSIITSEACSPASKLRRDSDVASPISCNERVSLYGMNGPLKWGLGLDTLHPVH